MVEKIAPPAGLELGTDRSVGQRLTHLAIGAPHRKRGSIGYCIHYYYPVVLILLKYCSKGVNRKSIIPRETNHKLSRAS